MDVLIGRLVLQLGGVGRLHEREVDQRQDLAQQVGQLPSYAVILLAQVLLEGDAHEELQELDKLHVRILVRVHRLIDHCHLRKIELHLHHTLRDEAPDTFEDFLGGREREADLLRIHREDFHDTFQVHL